MKTEKIEIWVDNPKNMYNWYQRNNQAVIMDELRETIERNKFGEKITELISERGLEREQNEHLTERVKELETELKAERDVVDLIECHGCLTGDCPHDKQVQCFVEIQKLQAIAEIRIRKRKSGAE